MKPAPLLLTLLALLLCAGCSLPDPKKGQRETEQRLLDDTDDRKARLQAQGTLNPQEYEALARKMGWTNKDARGIPPPPTTEELEKRVKEAQGNR
jgi:hypothetical protein